MISKTIQVSSRDDKLTGVNSYIKSESIRNRDFHTQLSKYADIEFIGSRPHNATSKTGPGAYNLPEIMGINRGQSLSTLKNSANISFGIKPEKKSFYKECYIDFVGCDSPGMKYSPNHNSIKRSNPRFSMSKEGRF